MSIMSKKVKVDHEVLNNIFNYLAGKPWKEVAVLIEELNSSVEAITQDEEKRD